MAVALVDTNVLFASASARDQYHERAREIVAGIDHGELPTGLILDYVLAETLNLVGSKLGSGPAEAMLDRLQQGTHFEIVHTTRSDFDAATSVFRRFAGLSFVDATLVTYMNREEIKYLYSFDDDFDAVDGLERLDAARNPFS